MAATGQISSLSGAWLTTAEQNAVIGYPAAETYPGPVSEPHGPIATGEPLVRNEALTGLPAGPGYPAQEVPSLAGGGVISDTVDQLGHSGPVADFAAQTEPFAPPGPIAPTHGDDTGGTYRTENVLMPRSPGWWRRVLTMQTYNRQSFKTDDAGWQQLAVNGRQDHVIDQGQALDPATRWLPYSERPVTAKYAAEAYPIQDPAGGPYNPSGQLSDMYAMGGQGNTVYEAPPDPQANVHSPVQMAPADPLAGLIR